MITAAQMRAARALAGIDQKTLAERAGVSLPTIQRMEASDGVVRGVVDTLMKVIQALDDPRYSDVDEWGRSEHMRQILAKLYDPIYEKWFRVEWDGLDKIPTEGGALLVSNHAGAIPSDAPVIMHGIEKELRRPVYGLADQLFRSIPVVGVYWSRLGGVVAHPAQDARARTALEHPFDRLDQAQLAQRAATCADRRCARG